MDFSKLKSLRQVKIEAPCSENWDAMSGNEAKRFCAGCGCNVHNIAEMSAQDAEILLKSKGRICTRIETDADHRVLTRDGWIPRLLLAGAVAATAASGAAQSTLKGKILSPKSVQSSPSKEKPSQDKSSKDKSSKDGVPTMKQPTMGITRLQEPTQEKSINTVVGYIAVAPAQKEEPQRQKPAIRTACTVGRVIAPAKTKDLPPKKQKASKPGKRKVSKKRTK
jgi:hypothetical protein